MRDQSEQIKPAPITDRQPAPVARFIVSATIDGFPVSVEVEGKATVRTTNILSIFDGLDLHRPLRVGYRHPFNFCSSKSAR